MVAVFIIGEFRFRFIQPENTDAIIIIIFLDLVPYKFSGIRIGRIKNSGISQLIHSLSEIVAA